MHHEESAQASVAVNSAVAAMAKGCTPYRDKRHKDADQIMHQTHLHERYSMHDDGTAACQLRSVMPSSSGSHHSNDGSAC